jgi:regulator-associated protein of mTOR
MKDRMKTMSVALIMCLNIGVDPPDVLKIAPCARAECWINPLVGAPAKALDAIGKALQAQYERWQPRARYKAALDPTAEDVRKLCLSCRRNAKGERVLVHYTGHGVPRPTPNGEIWVFNKSYTQYIPLSIFDLHAWTGTPAIYVLDCSGAGHILNALAAYGEARAEGSGGGLGALMGPPGGGDARAAGASGRGGGAAAALLGLTPDGGAAGAGIGAGGPASPGDAGGENAAAAREVVMLAACAADELLPCSPDLPADVFTACLTSPIKMALRWFCLRSPLRHEAGLEPELADAIPGLQNNRKTPLGELNWIFTAITDTIAWNVLPRPLFQRLFRQDLLVASLFRNYLLAERVLRALSCTPRSSPALPSTAGHPMWAAWDMALEACLLQLPALLAAEAAGAPAEFTPSPFFSDQLSAFEVWLEHGADDDVPPPPMQHAPHHHGYAGSGYDDDDGVSMQAPPTAAAAAAAAHAAAASRAPPEQLPIVLQVLLSQSHRLRALVLLGRFLDKGPWAVDLALSVGIFPYVLKLLQTTAADLRHILVFIWTKILALDRSCQADLVKDNAFVYFIRFLDAPEVAPEERALAAFALACVCDGHTRGQAACAAAGLGPLCLGQLAAAAEAPRGATLLRWLALALAKLWAGNAPATAAAFAESAPEMLALLLAHASPELRVAGAAALGALVAPPRGAPPPPAPPQPPQSPEEASPAGTAAQPQPGEAARDPMSESARHAAERAVVSQLLPLAADGSPAVRREVVVALARVAAGHPAHFHAAQLAWQRSGRTAGGGTSFSSGGGGSGAVPPATAAEAMPGTSHHDSSGLSAPQRAASGAASMAAAAASAAATAAVATARALSPGQRNSSSGYFSPSPAVGDMSFGDFSAVSGGAMADVPEGAATNGDETAVPHARSSASAVPRVPSNLGRSSSSSLPPAPVAVPVSPAAGSLAGVAVFADADGQLLFAPTPPGHSGHAGSAGSGGAGGSSLAGSSAGLYASADAARLGGGLYAHVLETLLAAARDPAPRVAAAARQALEALGAERLLGPTTSASGSGNVGAASTSAGREGSVHPIRSRSMRGAVAASDAPPGVGAGSYGSSWGGGGRLAAQMSGLPERTASGAGSGAGGTTWAQRLSSWVGTAVGVGGGGDVSPLRRGSDSASTLLGSSHGGFAQASAMDVRQSDGSAALAMLQGGMAASLERGGPRLTLGDIPGGSQRGGVGGSQRGGSTQHGFTAAAALQAALPPLPSSTAFEAAAVHFSRPLLAPAASPAAYSGDEAAVEEAPEAPPPGVPTWVRRPDAGARSARRATAASRAARAAAAMPTGCTELLASLEPDASGQATTALCLHPLRPLVAIGDAAGVVRVWSRPEQPGVSGSNSSDAVLARFRAAAGGRSLACLALLNPWDDALLVACAADGAVRVWRDWAGGAPGAPPPGLAAAWRALPGALPTRPPPRWPAAFALQQEAGCLYAAGEAGGGGGGALHVWDLGREAQADAVPLSTLAAGAGVTCLSAAAGALLLGGASDGRLLSFDLRSPARLLSSARLHTAPLRGVLLQPGGAPHALITASAAGELVWTDLRAMMEPLAVVQAHRSDCGGLTALAGHAAAPLVATGSAERTVRLFDVAARPLGAVKYAPAFMAPRAMPVSCLAFSPTEALLCAGGADGGAALYVQPERRGSRDDAAYAYAGA